MSRIKIGWILAVCFIAGASDLRAVTRFKADNTNNLNLSSSWMGGNVPGAYDVALWSNNISAANATLLGGNMSVLGLWVTSPTGEVAVGGSHALTLGFKGIDMSAAAQNLVLTNQTVALLDYVCPVFNVAAGRTLTLSPAVFVRGANASLGVQGSGAVASSALVNDATGIIGTWARYGTGTNTKYAAMSGGIVAGAVGTAAATAAAVTDTTGTANYDVAAAGTLGAGASFNTLRYTWAGGTVAGGYAANGLLNAGSGVLTMSGSAAVGAGKELVLMSPDTTRRIDLTGRLSDGVGGASGVTVTGGGQVRLTASNDYSGVTAVSSGQLYVNNPGALGTTNGNTVVHVNGSSSTGGQLQLAGGITLAEPLTFVGVGDGDPWNSALAVAGSGGTNTLTGPITITGAGVRFTAGGNGTALNLNGPVVRTSGGNTLILGAGGTGGALNVNVPINNNGGGVNTHNGPGLIRLNAAGCNFGTLNVQVYHLVQLGVSEAMVSGCSINVGGSATDISQSQGTFDMNGFSQTCNNFTASGLSAVSLRIVTNSAAALSTLTIGSGNGGGTFNGVIDGNILLVKNGSGSEILCGPNRYSGGTTVNGGTLVLSNAVNHGGITVNGGTMRIPTSLYANGNLAGTGGTLDLVSTATVLTVNQTGDTYFAGAITNGGSLVKDGSGVLALYGHNSYVGGTVVSNGILILGKTISKPAAGSITVLPGALVGLGLGGAGAFSSAQVDALWAGTFDGVTLGEADPVAIDTALGDASYATGQSTRGLIKTGNNTLTLSGVNTYPGSTIIRQGVLSIPATSALPGWDVNGRYQVWRNAGLAVGNAVGDADVATILGTTNFMDGGCIGFDTSVGSRTYANVISNSVNGALGLFKVGTNTLTLTVSNMYDGTTFVNGGMLTVKHSSALGSTNGITRVARVGGTVGIPAGSYSDSTGQVRFDASAGPLVIDENFVINGAEQYVWQGPLRGETGNTTLNGVIRIGALGGRVSMGGGNLVLNGRIEREDLSTNPGLTCNIGAGTLTISNRIDIGTGTLNFHSGGINFLCSTGNVYGVAQIQYSGTLRLGVDDALAVTKKLAFGNPEPGNGRFDLNGYSQTLGGLQEFGTIASKPNNIITNGRPASVSTLTINQAAGVSDLFSGRILGAISVVKAGATNSTLTLVGTNTYSGSTVVKGGTLVAGTNGVLGVSSTNVVVEAGTLALQNSSAINDNATIGLAGGGVAKVSLATDVNEKVAYLFVDGQMQRAGTYGSTGSAAANKNDALFSGTGVLTVRLDNSGTLFRVQ